MPENRRDHELPAALARLGWRYHHLGLPHAAPRAGERSLPHLGVHVCGFETSPFGIEWMRFDPHCRVPDAVRTLPHLAFVVDDLDAALAGRELLIAPNSPSPGVRVAFILDDGAPVELLEFDRPAEEGAYREDLAYIHDAGYGEVARGAAEVLLAELAQAGLREGTIVDLGCGSGILAARVAAAGYRVVGIDVSPSMVELAHRRAPEAEFRVASFVDADIPPCVAVTAIGEVLNYGFDPANGEHARADLFARVHRALAPGGVFLFDAAGTERARPGGPHRTFAEGPDWAVLVETDADGESHTLTRRITGFRQVGSLYRRSHEVHRIALMRFDTLREALRAAAFEVRPIPGYGDVALPQGVTAFLCGRPSGDR
jgi:SAM-dependent methyltransferase